MTKRRTKMIVKYEPHITQKIKEAVYKANQTNMTISSIELSQKEFKQLVEENPEMLERRIFRWPSETQGITKLLFGDTEVLITTPPIPHISNPNRWWRY
jgi:hypothetical protein